MHPGRGADRRQAARPIDGCVTAIARFCDCKVWVSRDTMVPSYVFFGFDADTAMASYLFTVIDRAMATALTAFRMAQPRLRGVALRPASKSFQQGMAARIADRLDAMHRNVTPIWPHSARQAPRSSWSNNRSLRLPSKRRDPAGGDSKPQPRATERGIPARAGGG